MMSRSALILIVIVVFAACTKLTDEELWNEGVQAQKQDKFDESLKNYEQLLTDYPKSPKVPEALYAIATICQNQKRDFGRAIWAYRRIVQEFPTHATASGSLFLIGFLYNNELKNIDSAKAAYTEFLQKYPDSPMASSATFELANLGKDPSELIDVKSEPLAKAPKETSKKSTKK
jgi:TolA-binding protein